MRRSTTRDVGNRTIGGATRHTIDVADDSTLLQELKMRGFHGESMDTIEHAHPYGYSSVPKKPTTEGGKKQRAEAFVVFLGGNRSHGVAVAVSDRRFRPNNLTEGEVINFDDQMQQVYFHRDRIVIDSTKEVHVQRGSAHVLLAADKVKVQFGDMSVTMKGGKIYLGKEGIDHAVMTVDGPSEKVFCVIAETDSAMSAAKVAKRTKKQKAAK